MQLLRTDFIEGSKRISRLLLGSYFLLAFGCLMPATGIAGRHAAQYSQPAAADTLPATSPATHPSGNPPAIPSATPATKPLPRTTTGAQTQIDTTKSDTSKSRIDTTYERTIPIPHVGSIAPVLPSYRVITDSIRNFMDYSSPGDLFAMQNGFFIRDLGSLGQFNGITINGVNQTGVAFLSDGVPLQEPMSGAFDMNLYPTEQSSRIELITGTRAFLYALNGTGGTINFVSKSQKALHPASRIRYTEASYGLAVFDGMVSQDIIRGLNITAGAQHMTMGGKFTNTRDDAWNARLKLRYNFNNRFNFFASEMYNQTDLGLFGGVVDSLPLLLRFDPIQATVRNQIAYEMLTRHDLQLGVAARLVGDSTLISTLTLYHSSNLRELRNSEIPGIISATAARMDDERTQWFGARFTHTLTLGRQQIDAGAEVERRGVVASPITGQHLNTRTALFGKTETSFLHPVTLAGYVRFDQYLERTTASFGADGDFAPDSLFSLFGGFSHSFRFPSFEEQFWNDTVLTTTMSSSAPEKHDLFEAGIRSDHPGSISGELKLFHREIHDAYIIVPQPTTNPLYAMSTTSLRTIRGLSGSLSIRYGKFFAEGSGQYIDVSDSAEAMLPKLSGVGGIYYWTDLLEGHLNLKAGLRGRIIPSFTAPGYEPVIQRFVPNQTSETQTAGIVDVVIIAKLGDAYLHLILDNFFDNKYIITSYYPMTQRQLRFGVSWDFMD